MNKLDLIETLKTEAGISKTEAVAVVNLFFDEMANALANGWKSGDYVRFMLKNTNHTPAEIQKLVNWLRSSRRSCRFLNAGKS